MGKSLKDFSAYRNYFFKILIILLLFAFFYRILYPSVIWSKLLFFVINIISERIFSIHFDRIYCCYFTLATGLMSCFFSQILFSVLKIVYLRLKGYGRKYLC